MPFHDLTHDIESEMPTYPGDPEVVVEPCATFEDDGYQVSELRLGSHAGTHVDAPSHTESDGDSLGDFPVEAFRFDSQLVDLDVAAREPIQPEDLPNREGDAELLVLRTGWESCWGTDQYCDHPYLTREAAERCADRGWHVGIDAFSVDPTPSERAQENEPEGIPAHHALLGAGQLVIENLRNLDSVPKYFTLHAYPLAVDADAAPVRAVAEW